MRIYEDVAMDDSEDELNESGCSTESAESDDDVADDILEEMRKFQESFRGISRRYRLLNRIGEGTFSTVYKAEDLHYDKYRNDWDVEETERLKWSPRRRRREPSQHRHHHHPSRPRFVAIKKIYVTSSPLRIFNELELLHDLRACAAVCPLITAFRHQDQVVAVLPYVPHCDFRDYFRDLSVADMRRYLRSLLTALRAVHAHGILHRDIKPTNFLYNPARARGVLVDFGLAEREGTDWHPCACQLPPAERRARAQTCVNAGTIASLTQQSSSSHHHHHHHPHSQHQQQQPSSQPPPAPIPSYPKTDTRPSRRANRAGTRGFRAPEVLLKCTAQTCAIDVWSVGVILLTLLSRRFPFFHSADDVDALCELAAVFGRRRLRDAALRHGQLLETNIPSYGEGGHSLEKVVLWCAGGGGGGGGGGRDERGRRMTAGTGLSASAREAVAFLEELLQCDPERRLTADQALRHSFLAEAEEGMGEEDEDDIELVG